MYDRAYVYVCIYIRFYVCIFAYVYSIPKTIFPIKENIVLKVWFFPFTLVNNWGTYADICIIWMYKNMFSQKMKGDAFYRRSGLLCLCLRSPYISDVKRNRNKMKENICDSKQC